MKKNINIMIVGVGGQGTLLASRVLGRVGLTQGYDVKVSEVHGMAQRGGSVVTYVKLGEKVYSPIVKEGEADFVLAFEKLEAARYLSSLKPGGRIIANNAEIDPMSVLSGAAEYPHDVLETLKAKGVEVIDLDALSIAIEAGTSKAVNIVLMGVLSSYFEVEEEVWLEALKEVVPPKFFEVNVKAFRAGRALGNH